MGMSYLSKKAGDEATRPKGGGKKSSLSGCHGRCRNRKPSGSGVALKGRTKGLPRRYQTDPRLHMTWQDTGALTDAMRFASAQEIPLTAHLTVTWRSAPGFRGKDENSWTEHHQKLVRKLKAFLSRHGIPTVFIYVRERVVGPGGHTHFVLHIPEDRWTTLRIPLERYLQKAGGFTAGNAVRITGNKFNTLGIRTDKQRIGLIQYLSKTINPGEMIATGCGTVPLVTFMGIKPAPHASLPCKRIGWSENIGPTARNRADYRDMKTLLEVAACFPTKTTLATARRVSPEVRVRDITLKAPRRRLGALPSSSVGGGTRLHQRPTAPHE